MPFTSSLVATIRLMLGSSVTKWEASHFFKGKVPGTRFKIRISQALLRFPEIARASQESLLAG